MLSRTLLILVYPINRVGKTLLWEIEMKCKTSNIFSSTMPPLKAVLASLVIALSLTSDTASSVTQVQGSKVQVTKVKEPSCSTNSFVCASTGQRPRYLACQSWTLPLLTLPSE